jgi:hypothetical protein
MFGEKSALARIAAPTSPGLGRIGRGCSMPLLPQNSSSGAYAVTVTDATFNHPHRIAVRFSGGSGCVVWASDKGYSVGSWSRHYGRGLHWLAYVGGKDSCDVTASVGGSGRVKVQILM